jgi:hypothetical protein
MYIVKYVTPQSGSVGNAKSGGDVGVDKSRERDRIVAEVVRGMEGSMQGRPGLAGRARETVSRMIADEQRFVKSQSKPASALAEFARKEAERGDEFVELIGAWMREIVEGLPDEHDEAGVLHVEVPFITLVWDANGLVQRLCESIVAQHFDGRRLSYGAGLAATVVARLCRMSKVTLADAQAKPHRIRWPKQFELPADELVESFFGDTPLAKLLLSPVAVKVPDKVRMEHMLITAGAGHGKTQTLQHMIARDLDRPKGHEAGMVVIDSQGDLVNRIVRLKTIADERLLIVDASDVEHPIALNLFDLGGVSMASMSLSEREQATNATVQLYEYVIGGLFGSELTAKQGTVFKFLIRLMLSIPGATIYTLRDCLEEPTKFLAEMDLLPATARQFFKQEFVGKGFAPTRKQILSRLYGVLQNPTFERMFAAKHNKLDLGQALNKGRVVVVNTSRAFLQDECKVFGRYIIAVTMKAAFDRASIAPEARRTSFLYVDEASDYFDDNVGQLLVQARKYKLGCIFAHQALEQLGDGLKAIMMANTSIKLVGGASAKDARAMAPELRCTPEFILGQQKDGAGTAFAGFVRNVTPAAVSWRMPFLTMEKNPALSDSELEKRVARNRREVC